MTHKDWWKGAVIYQIYPRSYRDTNNDGVGDLPGIIEKLDYIASLGVDGVWISPFFQSPMRDFGYDVSDYRNVDPLFGTNEDFDRLLAEAHKRDLKIIVDLVMSHTSEDHPWFKESRQKRDNPRADWYVWADPKPDGTMPNNWLSLFGGPAWTYDVRRGQYYLHNFLSSQPDLNFHNPEVQDTLLAEARYWLDRGVDGFRLDVVNFYFHSPTLHDNPARKPGEGGPGTQITFPEPYGMQRHLYDKSQPENLGFIQRMRALTDEYPGTFMVGEIGDDAPIARAAEYTAGGNRLHTAYNFSLISSLGGDMKAVRKALEDFAAEPGDPWPSWAFSNHDTVRAVTRWGRELGLPEHRRPALARTMIALLCSLRGTAYLYQGEELALSDAVIPFDRIQDPYGRYLYPLWQGRDGCRTPMPWSDNGENAGFTAEGVHTWLPIPSDHLALAAEVQDGQHDSVLNFTRSFLAWRQRFECVQTGKIIFHDLPEPLDGVLAFSRQDADTGETLLFMFNFTDKAVRIRLPETVSVMMDVPGTAALMPAGFNLLPLLPYSFAVGSVSGTAAVTSSLLAL